MGTTFSSIHIYSPDLIQSFPNFRSFSAGWQTYMPDEEQEDPFVFQKLAKKLSKNTDAPVLWFYIFDSEVLMFEFYREGKKVAAYSPEGYKNLYVIPALVGYDDGQKRRLSNILDCVDMEFQVQLLEEYFGVCLIPFSEFLEHSPDSLVRIRSDKLYQAYLAEEKKLIGKQSPIKATLVSEVTGKLFERRFKDADFLTFTPHHYYFGYDTWESNWEEGALRTVRFEQGKLVPISQEEFDAAPKKLRREARVDGRISEDYFPVYKVHFTDKAPERLKNKTLIPPRGYSFCWFDEKGRAVLSNGRDGIAIVDETLKIIAKIRVKGCPVDYFDGYLLTAGSGSFCGYCFEPSNAIRIYRIYDK